MATLNAWTFTGSTDGHGQAETANEQADVHSGGGWPRTCGRMGRQTATDGQTGHGLRTFHEQTDVQRDIRPRPVNTSGWAENSIDRKDRILILGIPPLPSARRNPPTLAGTGAYERGMEKLSRNAILRQRRAEMERERWSVDFGRTVCGLRNLPDDSVAAALSHTPDVQAVVMSVSSALPERVKRNIPSGLRYPIRSMELPTAPERAGPIGRVVWWEAASPCITGWMIQAALQCFQDQAGGLPLYWRLYY